MLCDSLRHILTESFKAWAPGLADPEQCVPRPQVLHKTLVLSGGASLEFEMILKGDMDHLQLPFPHFPSHAFPSKHNFNPKIRGSTYHT